MTDAPRNVSRDDAPDPEALLKALVSSSRGHHKIYVGAAAGVGKTYRALQEIRERREAGVDALIGLLETHGREETERMASELEVFPRQRVDYKGVTLTECDLEGLKARRPELVLIDELAHTNVPGSRHKKRYEDVDELLSEGINVISTMNVQHLESANDLVARLTGVRVKERVPDRVLLEADEVILVDVTPEVLRERLKTGKIYSRDKIEQALTHFFTTENLAVLRELALREVADAVEDTTIENGSSIKERIAVAVTARPEATRLIRRGARLAQRLDGEFYVVHVRSRRLSRDEEKALDVQRLITESLNGEFVQLTAPVVPSALIQFVRERRITQIVMGSSLRSRWLEFLKGSVINRVLRATQGVDVYVIGQEQQEP
jgi:two-component system sensor histidine kinase KdpD